MNIRGKELQYIFHIMITEFDSTFMLLTKRPERMKKAIEYMNWQDIPPNIWLGVTAENQRTADERIPIFLQIPAAVRFVSVEPMLSEMEIIQYMIRPDQPVVDWVICGGETGPGARPMNPDWARSLRDQCKDAGVPFFMKKMSGGGQPPDDLMIRNNPGA